MNNFKVKGVVPPLITPMTSDLDLDADALIKLIDHVIEGGVSGLFLLGTTGENTSLTDTLRQEVIKKAVRAVDGRIPVYVNITTSSYMESTHMAEMAASMGAHFVVLAPPFYFDMSQAELLKYVEKINGNASLPLFLYNAPQYTKTAFTPETVEKLAEYQNIVGIKDSSGDIKYVKELLKRRSRKDFSIMVGPELLLGECIILGCDGGVNGGSNMFPELYVSMFNAAVHNNRQEMNKLQRLMRIVNNRVYEAVDSPMSIVIGIKYVLSVMGICSPQMAMPVYTEIGNSQKQRMEELVKEFESYGLETTYSHKHHK